MSKRTIVHVGLGKTGSTFLQRGVLPYLDEQNVLHNDREILQKISNAYYSHKVNPKSKVKINQTDLSSSEQSIRFISAENIIGWNPRDFKKALKAAKYYLPEDSEIMITMREPKEWLRSLYLHSVTKCSVYTKPEHFFVGKDQMDRYQKFFGELSDNLCISVDDLRYQEIETEWKKCFKNIHIVRMEDIFNSSFLDKININITSRHLRTLSSIKSVKTNRSFSREALHLNIIRNKILRKEFYKYPSSSYSLLSAEENFFRSEFNYTEDLTDWEIKSFNTMLCRLLKKDSINISKDEYFSLITYKWRKIIQLRDPQLNGTKYELPKNIYLGKYYNENKNYYSRL